jgi:hypothetical protein
MQTCAAIAYEPADGAIAINEAVETKNPTCLAFAAVPFVPVTVVNTFKTAKKISPRFIKGGINEGDTLPSGIGSVVKVNRGSSPNSVQYQSQVSGFPYGHEYSLKYSKSNTHNKAVDFDGAKVENINGVDLEIFIEAKGLSYEKFFSEPFGGAIIETQIAQAKRQVEAILENGIKIDLTKCKPLEWHFAELGAKNDFLNAIQDVKISNGEFLKKYVDVLHSAFSN